MKKTGILFLLLVAFLCSCVQEQKPIYNKYVNKFIGSDPNGCITPVASLPFGMVQIGADTHNGSSGYRYKHTEIIGFSHVHKSGAGCGDFLDILFMPLPVNMNVDSITTLCTQDNFSSFSHEREWAEPGSYSVDLYNGDLNVELTASLRCGLQRYTYKTEGTIPLIVDLEHGARGACTIQPEHNVDTVYDAAIEKVDDYTIRGYRLTNGFAPEQHVYFYTTFSSPIKTCTFYKDNERVEGLSALRGRNVKAILTFVDGGKELDVKTGISAVDLEGAYKNHLAEVKEKDFEQIKKEAVDQWSSVLGQIEVETKDEKKKEMFYSFLHNVMMYPMLYSDVDYRFRGPDRRIHQTDGFPYYGGVVGLWDTFRAACPLIAVLHPHVIRDYIKTALEFYKYVGQLPILLIAGIETYQMAGIHSMPLITNGYMNGITDFDTELAMRAMVESANTDTCGYSMGYFVGLKNYKKYGYVPCDLEMESVARTLEYAFDDRAIAQFASLTNHPAIQKEFYARSLNYKNVMDPKTLFARGRKSDGSWREPFDPLRSEHRKDDYCEGNAWQWTFFVPHDVEGLAELMGGEKALETRLDSLFTMSSSLSGEDVSGDISGLIGQYAHGNEPGHHTIYMYNKVGQPKKTQKYVNEVLTTLYDTTSTGICGNEDTGQMSAWYVFSSLGLYPMDPVSGRYELSAPLFDKATMKLPSGKEFVVVAENLSDKNIYVEQVWLNDTLLDRTYITFDELLNGGTLRFKMTDQYGL